MHACELQGGPLCFPHSALLHLWGMSHSSQVSCVSVIMRQMDILRQG